MYFGRLDINSETFQRLLFASIAALAAACAVFLTFLITDNVSSRLTAIVSAVFISYFFFRVVMYSTISNNRLKLAIMTSTSAACISISVINAESGVVAQVLSYSVNALNKKYQLGLPNFPDAAGSPYISFVALVVLGMVAIVLARQIQPATGIPTRPLSDILPEVGDYEWLDKIRKALVTDLNKLDESTRWDDSKFVPLQAQVQVLSSGNNRSRVVDLIQALRRNQKSRIFIVLGDPGSGKSVAMRKLARDLLAEGPRSRIPIYFNLREWRTTKKYTESTPPTTQDFKEFIYSNLRDRILDFRHQEFLFGDRDGTSVFEALREAGHIFFIFDSFDEIPAVLDHDESSWLVQRLSNCIASYAVAGVEARGVIASRLFRKPRVNQTERTILEIRPFTEHKIVQAIKREKPRDSRALIEAVISKRADLGYAARNPFLLSLIIFHYNYRGSIPSSQKEVFETYLSRNIEFARKQENFEAISPERLYQLSEKIAWAMFSSSISSLEIRRKDLRAKVDDPDIDTVIEFLVRSKIGRMSFESDVFSFSHRRFNEFFLVRGLETGTLDIPLDAIQTDNKWRDALVLYTEIATEDAAVHLAEHAWKYARRLPGLTIYADWTAFIESRHALRFIIDGFRNRPWILPMRSELADLIVEKLATGDDLIEKRTVIEAVTLLDEDKAFPIIEKVLKEYPGWLSEAAATATRYLPKIDPSLALTFYYHTVKRVDVDTVRHASRLSETLSISEATKSVSKWLRLYCLDFYKTITILAIFQLWACIEYGSSALVISFVIFTGYFAVKFTFLVLIAFESARASGFGIFSSREPKRDSSRNALIDFVSVIPSYLKFILILWLGMALLGEVIRAASRLLGVGPSLPTLILTDERTLLQLMNTATWRDALIFYTVIVVAILPLQPPPYMLLRQFKLKLILLILVSAMPFFAFIAFTMEFVRRILPEYLIKYGVQVVSVLMVAVTTLSGLYYIIRDYVLLKKSLRGFDGSRTTIARDFAGFHLAYFRRKYVAAIEDISIGYREVLADRLNSWPLQKRPLYENDLASVELARLDARWLGLD